MPAHKRRGDGRSFKGLSLPRKPFAHWWS